MKTSSYVTIRDRVQPHIRIAEIDRRIRHLELTCFRRARTAYGCARYGLDSNTHVAAGNYLPRARIR